MKKYGLVPAQINLVMNDVRTIKNSKLVLLKTELVFSQL